MNKPHDIAARKRRRLRISRTLLAGSTALGLALAVRGHLTNPPESEGTKL